MKKLLIILICCIFVSCDCKHKIRIIDNSVEVRQEPPKQMLEIQKDVYENIMSFRPAVRDIAIYFLVNKEDFSLDQWCFKCNKFQIWICNDFDNCEVYSPDKIGLNDREKKFFWGLYNDYRYNQKRQFEYEKDINISVIKLPTKL